jgi:uncharacterized membrane protein YdbT with pleckstrin-like domain
MEHLDHGFNLDSDEHIIKHIYHHWIDIASYATVAGVMLLVAFVIAYGYGRFGGNLDSLVPGLVIPGTVAWSLVVAFILLSGLILYFSTWVYKRNYLLLTNRHLIQVEQRGLFASQTDQVSLGRIQDVSGKRPGLLATLLGFGTVTIQSAGEQRQFVFRHVPYPQETADFILSEHEKFLKENPDAGH